jgi:hypothetical protein
LNLKFGAALAQLTVTVVAYAGLCGIRELDRNRNIAFDSGNCNIRKKSINLFAATERFATFSKEFSASTRYRTNPAYWSAIRIPRTNRAATGLFSHRSQMTRRIFRFFRAQTDNAILQVHSCRSEDALAQKRCEIKAEGRGDGSKKIAEKSLKTDRIWSQ